MAGRILQRVPGVVRTAVYTNSRQCCLSQLIPTSLCTADGVRAGEHTRAEHSAFYSTSPTYEQGQQVGKQREYYYFIDHNGQLFLDDARMKNFTSCFKGANASVVSGICNLVKGWGFK